MAGAKLMMVMDNVEEEENSLELVGDGRNEDVTIPSIMISLKDGEQLVSYLAIAQK